MHSANGSTDGHDEADGRFSQICENTLKKTNQLMLNSVTIVVCFQIRKKNT